MSLTGTVRPLDGAGGGGAWLGNRTEEFGATGLNVVRDALRALAGGGFVRSIPIGGSLSRGLVGASVVDALDAIDFEIDNSSGYLTSSSGITIPIVVWVRVADAGISVTPQIYNVTDSTVATTSGGAACSATAADFSGTNSKQTLTLTPANGVKTYRLRFTPSASSAQFWGAGWRSLYI